MYKDDINGIIECTVKTVFSIFWESWVGDQQEPGERSLPAAPGPPPASARLASPMVVAAASLTDVASSSSIPSTRGAGEVASSPGRRPCVIVAVLEAPSRSAATWCRVGCVGGVGRDGLLAAPAAATPHGSVQSAPVLRRFASSSLLTGWSAVGGRYLLNEVYGHLRVDVLFGVDRIRPACEQNLLGPLPAASRAADQFNCVQDDGWGQFLPEEEFQLGEAG